MKDGPYSIGSAHWPGLSKLAEEAGEVLQRLGKIMGCNGREVHFDGSNNVVQLTDELGDLIAAALYAIEANDLDREVVDDRVQAKLRLFRQWHVAQRELPA